MQEHTLRNEGPSGQLGKAIQQFQKGYNPQLLYVFVNKRVTTRFFEKQNGHHINPGPGTVIDSVVVENKDNKIFDFYMVANDNPATATALPVHYEVAINTTQMTKDDIEKLTYQ